MIPPQEYERILFRLDSDLKRMRAIVCAMQEEVDVLKEDFYRNEGR